MTNEGIHLEIPRVILWIQITSFFGHHLHEFGAPCLPLEVETKLNTTSQKISFLGVSIVNCFNCLMPITMWWHLIIHRGRLYIFLALWSIRMNKNNELWLDLLTGRIVLWKYGTCCCVFAHTSAHPATVELCTARKTNVTAIELASPQSIDPFWKAKPVQFKMPGIVFI